MEMSGMYGDSTTMQTLLARRRILRFILDKLSERNMEEDESLQLEYELVNKQIAQLKLAKKSGRENDANEVVLDDDETEEDQNSYYMEMLVALDEDDTTDSASLYREKEDFSPYGL